MKYGTILADPPWAYANASAHRKLTGYANHEYTLLTTEDLSALPIQKVAADNSVLALWVTWPFLQDGLNVLAAWGFTYKTGLTWLKASKIMHRAAAPFEQDILEVKPHYGVGYWLRGTTELVLIGTRGHPLDGRPSGFIGFGAEDSTTVITHQVGHSRKPTSVHEVAEIDWPGPRLELFARRPRMGWTVMGDEIDGRDIREALICLM